MKITKKEITLLAVVALIAIVVVGVVYLIMPEMNKKKTIQDDYDTVKMQKDQSDSQIALIKNYKDKCAELSNEVEELKTRFFPETESPDLHISTLFPKETNASVKLEDLLIEREIKSASGDSEVAPAPDDAPTENPNGGDTITYIQKPAQPVSLSNVAVTIKLSGGLEETACKFAEQIEAEKAMITGNPHVVIEIASVNIMESEEENSTDYEAEYTLNFISAN